MFRDQIKELHEGGFTTTDGYALSAVLNQAYDMSYGLFNYEAQERNHPLASVMLHPGERLDYNSPRKQRFVRYRAAQVYKHTGLDFDKFLARPPYEVEEILSFCDEAEKQDVKTAKDALNGAGGQKQLNLDL